MDNEKIKSIIAYIFGLISGLIVLFMKGSERNTRVHAAQSITISIVYYIVTFAINFLPFTVPNIGTIISALYLIAIIAGIVKACKGDNPEIPVVGSIATSIFKKQIEQE